MSENTPEQSTPDVLLTPAEVSARWHYSPSTLRAQRHERRGIPYIRVGRNIFYRLSDVIAAEQYVTPKAQR